MPTPTTAGSSTTYYEWPRLTFFVVLFVLCSSLAVAGARIIVHNPLPTRRAQETIALSREAIARILPNVNVEDLGLTDAAGVSLLTQVTETELLFQTNLLPNEKKTFRLAPAKPHGVTVPLVDGRFMKPREDYAWENDHVAFRMYGPALAAEVNNGIDVWTKRVHSLIVAKWYKGDEDTGAARISYHIDHGEGADFFNVGKTLGAGGSGIWEENHLLQPGVFKEWRTLANGPLRTSFALNYDGYTWRGKSLKETKLISLDAGEQCNRIIVSFPGVEGRDTLLIACGLVKRPGTTATRGKEGNWVTLWGPTNEDPKNGSLGTALVLPRDVVVSIAEDKDQYLIIARLAPGKTLTYYAGAGWTENGDAISEKDWQEKTESFARRVTSPCHVQVLPE